jgi:putative restriction endonuclease
VKIFVGVTDFDWYSLHASKPYVEEVNFWRPSPNATFKILKPGEPFLFKLHSPRNFIVGGGFFAKFIQLPVSLAWDAFGEANGTRSLDEVKNRIAHYRKQIVSTYFDPVIGCILLEEPFFFQPNEWIPIPKDFSLNIVQGKSYDTNEEMGRRLWQEVGERLERTAAKSINPSPAINAAAETARYGNPTVVRPRLGQGTFRILITDAYNRRCTVTGEKTLPVLEAAHIRPYGKGGEHELTNGLLLRSDVHKLFDSGYITIEPQERTVVVSNRIREEFENGREYYALAGKKIALPNDSNFVPDKDNLLFHANNIYRG